MAAAANVVLRRASMADASLLHRWRTDPHTRAASHNDGEIAFDAHLAWLAAALSSTTREIYIAEVDGVAVGTVRVDRQDDGCELSWTVAPEARGRGVGSRMVAAVAASIGSPIRAEIKAHNIASARIAGAAGMRCVADTDGTLHFRRGPLLDEE